MQKSNRRLFPRASLPFSAQSDLWTPSHLPRQVLPAPLIRVALTPSQIFPYINQFLTSLNLVPNKSQIGFYSGLVVSFLFFSLPSTPFLSFNLRNPALPFSSCSLSTNGLAYPVYTLSLSCPPTLIRALDMVGRRPVIIIGTVGLSISTILFGLTSNLPQILIARCLGLPDFSTFSYSDTNTSGHILRHRCRTSLSSR